MLDSTNSNMCRRITAFRFYDITLTQIAGIIIIIIIIIINNFICNSTELDSHIQYIQANKIQGNTNATLRDTQRDTYKEDLFR